LWVATAAIASKTRNLLFKAAKFQVGTRTVALKARNLLFKGATGAIAFGGAIVLENALHYNPGSSFIQQPAWS